MSSKKANKKIKVGILFGGRSAEHEVSLQSAKNVIEALDSSKFEPVLIGIEKNGRWQLAQGSKYLLHTENPKLIALNESNREVALVPGHQENQLVELDGKKNDGVDVIFPVLHGTYGEDGTIQGLLKLSNIPFVGAGVLGSAIGMDKDVMKRLLKEAGLPVAKFIVVRKKNLKDVTFEKVKKEVGLPFFVKPANLGSSIGVNKVHDKSEFTVAIDNAFLYDNKILIEEGLKVREIECAVLGNEDPEVSVPGEVIPSHEFYSYDAKYIDENGASLEIPAKLSKAQIKEVQELAIAAFQALECSGMARVDCFLTDKGKWYVNEINTIPGFTKISMYPKLWEASGVSYKELITRLIKLAVEKYESELQLKTTV
jgi:D-alanine-D-alanine ligase